MSANSKVLHMTPPGVPGGVTVSAEIAEPGFLTIRTTAGIFTRKAKVRAVDVADFAGYLFDLAISAGKSE